MDGARSTGQPLVPGARLAQLGSAPPPGRGPRRAGLAVVGGVLVVALLAVVGVVLVRRGPGDEHAPSAPPAVLWQPPVPPGRSLLTNELAYRHPAAPGAHLSPDWIATSGSLFSDGGALWSGPVDGGSPDAASRTATGSAVLRAVSVRQDFGDVRVTLGLDVAGLTTTERTGERAYDGVHLFLRYTSPDSLYAVSLCRRDGTTAVKRKVPGATSTGGIYTTLAQVRMPCPIGHWQDYAVSVRDEAGGVRLTLSAGGRVVVSVLDDGQGGVSPLRGPGRVGLRGDNAGFHVRDLTVRSAD